MFLLSPLFWIGSSLAAFHDLHDCDITGQLFCRKPPEVMSSASQSLLNTYCVLDGCWGGDT